MANTTPQQRDHRFEVRIAQEDRMLLDALSQQRACSRSQVIRAALHALAEERINTTA